MKFIFSQLGMEPDIYWILSQISSTGSRLDEHVIEAGIKEFVTCMYDAAKILDRFLEEGKRENSALEQQMHEKYNEGSDSLLTLENFVKERLQSTFQNADSIFDTIARIQQFVAAVSPGSRTNHEETESHTTDLS